MGYAQDATSLPPGLAGFPSRTPPDIFDIRVLRAAEDAETARLNFYAGKQLAPRPEPFALPSGKPKRADLLASNPRYDPPFDWPFRRLGDFAKNDVSSSWRWKEQKNSLSELP
jgi:hypothetical protein